MRKNLGSNSRDDKRTVFKISLQLFVRDIRDDPFRQSLNLQKWNGKKDIYVIHIYLGQLVNIFMDQEVLELIVPKTLSYIKYMNLLLRPNVFFKSLYSP